jgi:hypothetical protein
VVGQIRALAQKAGFTVTEHGSNRRILLKLEGEGLGCTVHFIVQNPATGHARFHHADIARTGTARSDTCWAMKDLLELFTTTTEQGGQQP